MPIINLDDSFVKRMSNMPLKQTLLLLRNLLIVVLGFIYGVYFGLKLIGFDMIDFLNKLTK